MSGFTALCPTILVVCNGNNERKMAAGSGLFSVFISSFGGAVRVARVLRTPSWSRYVRRLYRMTIPALR